MIHTCVKYGMTMSEDKRLWSEHEAMSKTYFDLDVIGQGRIGIMNVRDTLSYGDTPMRQILLRT